MLFNPSFTELKNYRKLNNFGQGKSKQGDPSINSEQGGLPFDTSINLVLKAGRATAISILTFDLRSESHAE